MNMSGFLLRLSDKGPGRVLQHRPGPPLGSRGSSNGHLLPPLDEGVAGYHGALFPLMLACHVMSAWPVRIADSEHEERHYPRHANFGHRGASGLARITVSL